MTKHEMPTEIFVDKDFPSTMDNKFSLKEKERQKYVRADLASISEGDFDEWMTDRWNEYSRAGMDDKNAPNYEPHDAIEEFIKDFKEKFPEGVKILNGP